MTNSNESKHTPGPWKIHEPKYEPGKIEIKAAARYAPVEFCVAQFIGPTSAGAPDDEGLANAKLIAAAPELLEVVKEMYFWLSNNLDWNEYEGLDGLHHKMEKAIAKATGT